MKRMLALILAVCTLTACAREIPGNTPQGGVPVEIQETPQDSGVYLTLSLPTGDGEPLTLALRQLAKRYRDSGPGHNVSIAVRADENSEQTVLAQLLGAAPAELYLMQAELAPGFGQEGLLRELSGEFEEIAFYAPALESCGGEETLWAAPYLGATTALLYNPALLHKAALAGPPSTWKELREYCRMVSAYTEAAGFAGVAYQSMDLAEVFTQILASFGGAYIEEKNGVQRVAANSQAMRRALAFYAELVENGATEESELNDMGRAVQEFWLGRAAMCVATPAHLAMLEKNGFAAATSALPGQEAQGGGPLWGYAFAVPGAAGEREAQAACGFVRWLLEPEQLDFVLEAQYAGLDEAGQRPARGDLLLPLVSVEEIRFFAARPQYTVFLQELSRAVPPVTGKKWAQFCQNALLPALRRALTGEQTQEEALAALEQKGTEIWMN